MYTYKTVPAPRNLAIKFEGEAANAVAAFSQIINNECTDGWEFYSMETISVSTNPGCFSFKQPTVSTLNMLVFRKQAS